MRERPWRGKRPLSDGSLPPPNLPHLPELPCTATAGLVCENFSRFWVGGCRTGKFLVDWEARTSEKVRLRACLVDGVRRESVFHKCRFIPPHQSLTRQLPPKGKPLHPLHFSQQDGRVEIRKLGCFCNSACSLIFWLLPEIVFTMFARAYKRLPLGGKLSRKRLMRGDKSALSIGCIFPPKRTTHGSFRPDHQLTSCHFYPVAERVKTSAFRWRNAARSSRNS